MGAPALELPGLVDLAEADLAPGFDDRHAEPAADRLEGEHLLGHRVLLTVLVPVTVLVDPRVHQRRFDSGPCVESSSAPSCTITAVTAMAVSAKETAIAVATPMAPSMKRNTTAMPSVTGR